MNTLMDNTKGKNYSIEFIRFLFSILIVYYHLLYQNIIPYTNNQPRYIELQGLCGWSSLIVECFLIMGGYFLYISNLNKREHPFVEICLDRFARLWPVFALYVVINVIFLKMDYQEAIFELSFLHCTGISLEFKGIIWYIAPFFWCSIFIIAILRTFNTKVSAIILALCTYGGYTININYTNGSMGREVIYSFISLGMLRVMAGLSLGCLIAIGLTAFKKSFTPSSLKKRYGKMRFVFCSLVELASFCTLIKKFLFGRGNWTNSFSVVILFSLLFISLISDGGILSLILNRPIFAKLGCYSYSIYVMQQISFNIMAHTIWKNSTYLYNHTLRSLVISTLLAALLGIIVYHLVEKPCMLLYKKWKNNYIIQQ